MNLYLCQHAEAKPKDLDPERGLTEAGRKDAGKVADFFASTGLELERVLHSPKLRAVETAGIIASRMPAAVVEAADGLLPTDDPRVWAGRAGSVDGSVMLVGHMPHLGLLASLLVTGESGRQFVSFTRGSVLCLERDGAGSWSVAWMIRPELLK